MMSFHSGLYGILLGLAFICSTAAKSCGAETLEGPPVEVRASVVDGKKGEGKQIEIIVRNKLDSVLLVDPAALEKMNWFGSAFLIKDKNDMGTPIDIQGQGSMSSSSISPLNRIKQILAANSFSSIKPQGELRFYVPYPNKFLVGLVGNSVKKGENEKIEILFSGSFKNLILGKMDTSTKKPVPLEDDFKATFFTNLIRVSE